jgi:hypothetical protein
MYPYRDVAVLRRRITIVESTHGDGTFSDPSCRDTGHRKPIETDKNDKNKSWNDIPSGSIISQLTAGAVGSDSIWEMSVHSTASGR